MNAMQRKPTDFLEVQRQWKAAVKAKVAVPPTDYNALMQSLNACYECMQERRAFNWACSNDQKIAVLDRCIVKARGGLV